MKFRKLLISLVFIGPVSLLGLALYFYWQIPSTSEIKGCLTAKMNNVKLCPGDKNYVPLARISPLMQQTVILTEDSLFYQHKGFDWESIEKSARENYEKGQYARGGSTITQQLAKNLFLSKEKSLHRKLLEALITFKIEKTLSKKDILERYLNVIEFGKGVYGIKAASRHYFKKMPYDLTAAESAFLAMLLPNPVKYSSSFSRKELTDFATKRIQKILKDMHQYHRIDSFTYEQALYQMPSLFSPDNLDSMEAKWWMQQDFYEAPPAPAPDTLSEELDTSLEPLAEPQELQAEPDVQLEPEQDLELPEAQEAETI